MMRRHLAVGLVGIVSVLAGAGIADASSNVPSCGSLRASVPYSHHGHHDFWRVYVLGSTPCARAVNALKVVMHLGGAIHYGSSMATSYTDYRGWRCPFGQMGGQYCFRPKHPPYQTRAVALDCRVSCPASIPRSYFGP
jgi:hypothetical protein